MFSISSLFAAALAGAVAGAAGGIIFASTPLQPVLGVAFDNMAQARLQRNLGVLNQGEVNEAALKAINQFFVQGTEAPVVINLPPY